jgi:hypothetical protein
MSQETWELINSREIENIELQLALQCAPLIAGLKVSNLLNIHRRDLFELKKIMRNSELSWRILVQKDDKLTILLYHKESLESYMYQTKVNSFLRSFGYENLNLSYILDEFTLRYEKYMKEKKGFPHEMGLLLGYPVEDVTGFIEYQGTQSLYTGYWKVYKDKDEKIRLFESFENAKEGMIQLLSRGLCMVDIINLCHPHRNLHMNSYVKVSCRQ